MEQQNALLCLTFPLDTRGYPRNCNRQAQPQSVVPPILIDLAGSSNFIVSSTRMDGRELMEAWAGKKKRVEGPFTTISQ